MKCENFKNKYIELDNKDHHIFRLIPHFVFCKSCREFVRQYEMSLILLIDNYPFQLKRDISKSVMLKVNKIAIATEREVFYTKWLVVGALIFFSRLAITYSDSHIWLSKNFGESLGIPLNIVMGISITIYAAVFIISHLDDLKKRMHFKS